MTVDRSPVDEETARRLRSRLVEELRACGDLRSPEWEAAVARVPRHAFLPRFYEQQTLDGSWPLVTPERVGMDQWLRRVYANMTWVTQFDGRDSDEPDGQPVTGIPTSSSTLPGLVLQMFERLDVRHDDRAMIVGTGTGYSTALLCERLGDDRVVSVDVDPVVADRARIRLLSAGYAPEVLAVDGLVGHPARAPYDRIIAFCAVTRVPNAWVRQCRPGAVIVVTLTGGFFGFGLLKLRVEGDGRAQGRILTDTASFMTARVQATPRPVDLKPLMDDVNGPGRRAQVSPGVLKDPAFRFAAQIALPDVFTFEVRGDEVNATYVQHVDGRSWARVEPATDAHNVVQGGPRRLWDELEAAHRRWIAAGSPQPYRYGMTLTEERETVWLDEPNGDVCWEL